MGPQQWVDKSGPVTVWLTSVGPLWMQEGDAIVWELLGHATRIWHIATQQLSCNEEPALKAASRIFGYWSSRQAWLVSASGTACAKHGCRSIRVSCMCVMSVTDVLVSEQVHV